MQRLVAKGFVRSYSISKKRRNKPVATGIISDCDVSGGFMFNAKRYMHMNDAYFTPDQVMFLYEAKKIFDRIVHELHYLNIENPHHFALDLEQLDRKFEHRFLQSKSYKSIVDCYINRKEVGMTTTSAPVSEIDGYDTVY